MPTNSPMVRAPKPPQFHTADAKTHYQRWRASIPFTDQQIVDATMANAARYEEDGKHTVQARAVATAACQFLLATGVLTSRMYNAALMELVKTCNLCGKVAHYRIGPVGRCRAHKDVTTVEEVQRQQRLDAQSCAYNAKEDTFDAQLRAKDRKRKAGHSRLQDRRS